MRLANYTRYSRSIPRRLLREKFYLVPLYFAARLSDLAREGMDHSGSYRFADHIYAGRASGRLGLGVLVDRILLSLPACRSFRTRYRHSRDQILSHARSCARDQFRVLSAPCGLPRDLIEAARYLRQSDPPLFARARFFGLDIDPEALDAARRMVDGERLTNFEFIEGDALNETAYPPDLDVVTSSGFAEFIEDEALIRFYSLCHGALRGGGVLVTSATVRNRVADYLLVELAELLTHYRETSTLERIFARTPFGAAEMQRDAAGYQILIVAKSGRMS